MFDGMEMMKWSLPHTPEKGEGSWKGGLGTANLHLARKYPKSIMILFVDTVMFASNVYDGYFAPI